MRDLLLLASCCRKDKGKRHQQPEAELQAECVAWMRERDYLFIASAIAQYKNGARTAAGLARRGVEAGVPDLIILEKPARGNKGILAVELKVGKNKLSQKQQAWLGRAKTRGHTTVVAYTFREFKCAVMAHLHPGSGTAAEPYSTTCVA